MVEPLRVLLHPRVIGRHLDGEVQHQLESVFAGDLLKVQEIIQRAELRCNRVVSAGRTADRVRATRIVWARHERVVRALAVGGADRVNRRHVQGIKAHARDGRQTRLRLAEGRAAVWVGALRAREDLVPRRKPRALAIDNKRQLVAVARRVASIGPAVHHVG